MIALIQRVNWARVKIEGELYSEIGSGLLAFIGIEKADTEELAESWWIRYSRIVYSPMMTSA